VYLVPEDTYVPKKPISRRSAGLVVPFNNKEGNTAVPTGEPLIVVIPLSVPDPTVIEFKLVTPARVVIFGCDAVCKVPVILVADIDDKPDKVPDPTVMLFKLVTAANVVILGCDAVARVPVILVADIEEPPDRVPVPTVQPFKLVTPAKVVTLGCEAVCNVPVIVVALLAPILVTPAKVVILG
jgi:hypothetical protein